MISIRQQIYPNIPGLPGGDQLEEEQSTDFEWHWAAEGGAGGAGGSGDAWDQREQDAQAEDVQAQVPQQSCKFLYI